MGFLGRRRLTRDTALSGTEVSSFSTARDDLSRTTSPALVYHWHLYAVLAAYGELKALSSNRLEVRRLQAVCGNLDAVSVRRFNDYMGARSCLVVLESLHYDVKFVFSEAELK